MGMDLHMWGLVYVRGLWLMYVRRLAEALLCPFSFIFHLFHCYMQS